MYADKAKVLPILVKYTELPKDAVEKAYDFMVKNCIWDANHGLGPERVDFTAELMTKVGNIPQGKTPKYENIVDRRLPTRPSRNSANGKGRCACPLRADGRRSARADGAVGRGLRLLPSWHHGRARDQWPDRGVIEMSAVDEAPVTAVSIAQPQTASAAKDRTASGAGGRSIAIAS